MTRSYGQYEATDKAIPLPSARQFVKIWTLSWPLMVTNVLQILILVIDTFMVGRLGPDAIAAIGMGNAIRLFLFILVLSVSSGSISLMSQAYGTGDPARMSNVIRQSLISGLLLSLTMALIGFAIAAPVLDMMDSGNSLQVVATAKAYLYVVFLGLPFLVLNLISERLIQGAGDTRLPLLLTMLTIILNVGLNYVFIFGWGFMPALGVVGAAYGTIAARGIVLIIYFVLFKSKNYRIGLQPGNWKPDWGIIYRIMEIGLPSGLQGVFRRGTALFLVGFVTATELGTLGAAALTIGWQIESIIVQVVVGINVAGTSLVGYWIGRWQISESIKVGNGLMLMGIFISFILILPVLSFPAFWIKLFDPSANPDVIKGAMGFIYTSILSLPLASISIIATGAMRGAGDTKPPMYATIWFRCITTLIVAYLLTFTLDMGFMGVWWAIVVGRVLDTLCMIFFWARRKWIRVALTKSPLYLLHLSKLTPALIQEYLDEVRSPILSDDSCSEIVKEDDVQYFQPGRLTTATFTRSRYTLRHSNRTKYQAD